MTAHAAAQSQPNSQPQANSQPQPHSQPHPQPQPHAAEQGGGLRTVILGLAADIGIPVAVYYLLRSLGVDSYVAMLGGAAVAGLRLAWVTLRTRRFDGVAAFVTAIFAVGLVSSLLSGDERFLLAKDSGMTGIAGLIFLGSAVAGRPLIYTLHRRTQARSPEALAESERLWATVPLFRRTMTVMTVVWGVGLLAESAARVAVVYTLDFDTAVGASILLQVGALVLLFAYSAVARRRARRRGERVRAATAG